MPLPLAFDVGRQPAQKRKLDLILFTNDVVPAVNQHGEEPPELYKTEGSII